MGLFSNPLGYAGYPPDANGQASNVNSTVRAATSAETTSAALDNVYLSPATTYAAIVANFASPPALGFGSTTARPVHATTLDSTLNTDLANSAAATAVGIANVAPTSNRTGGYHGGNSAVDDTVTWLGGAQSLGTHTFRVFSGLATGGTQLFSVFSGNSSGGTQTASFFTNTRAGTFNVGTGAAAHTLNIGNSAALIGFFGATAVAQPADTDDLKVALDALGLFPAGGASPLDLEGGALGCGDITITDGSNVILDSTTGTQIGTATTQKLAFYGSTPVVQAANTDDLKDSLVALGFIADSGATPLDLDGGLATVGSCILEDTASVAGASPIINNVRSGQASFTDVINTGAYGTLTITNSTITADSIIVASASCVTANSAVVIADIVPGVGTVAFRCLNAGSANTAANIDINFHVLN